MKTFAKYFVLFFIVAFSSCQHNHVRFDKAYHISVETQRARRLAFRVETEDNDCHYFTLLMNQQDADTYNLKSKTDFVEFAVGQLREVSEMVGDSLWDEVLAETELFAIGSRTFVYDDLNPGGTYNFVLFGIDPKTLKPKGGSQKIEVQTKPVTPSDNAFRFLFEDGKLSITPSNNDSYFYVVEPKSYLDEEYFGLYSWFIYDRIDYLEHYDFMSAQVRSGVFVDGFEAQYMFEDSTYVAFAVGYDGEITTDFHTVEPFEFVYKK